MKKNIKKIIAALAAMSMTFSGLLIAEKPEVADAATPGVSVHEPSIVKGDDGYYYVFGSHMAWAKSSDMIHWTSFTNNINTDYETIFADAFEWAANGDSVYAPSGNLWAPDVIYNESLGKWTMYMSINGCSWNSSIVLLTADTLDGDWTYVGPVVYSGFNGNTSGDYSFTKTDYTKVTGDTSLNSRYTTDSYYCYDNGTRCTATTWNTNYGAHAIDPCVKYDENGDLWMSYGSWSGGIYLLKLDKATGLRDYTASYTYDTDYNDGYASDPYMGYHIAGGYRISGEASYLMNVGNYWYLFISYGYLSSTGGYNMRVFRSTKGIKGPYLDQSGSSSVNLYSTGDDYSNVNGDIGYKILGNYKWSDDRIMAKGEVAQGHNSAFVDSDGKMYLVYHTRYDDGTEGHNLRVNQMYLDSKGWLEASPAPYAGETLSTTAITASQVAGTYEVVDHDPNNLDYAKRALASTYTLNFSIDGKIYDGSKNVGTWAVSGTNYITFTIAGVSNWAGEEFKGVLVPGVLGDKTVLTFSASEADYDTAMWGRKLDVYDYANYTENSYNETVTIGPAFTNRSTNIPTKGDFTLEYTLHVNAYNSINQNAFENVAFEIFSEDGSSCLTAVCNGDYWFWSASGNNTGWNTGDVKFTKNTCSNPTIFEDTDLNLIVKKRGASFTIQGYVPGSSTPVWDVEVKGNEEFANCSSSMVHLTGEYTDLTEITVVENTTSVSYNDISSYRSATGYTAPSMDGMIFGGWYSDQELTTPLSSDTTSGSAYAKFVSDQLLTVKAQLAATTNANSVSSSLRILTAVDDDDYAKIGYKISHKLQGRKKTSNLDVTASTLIDTVNVTTYEGTSEYSVGQAFGDGKAKYSAPLVINGISNSNFETAFTVTPYAVTADGTTVTGTARVLTIAEAL